MQSLAATAVDSARPRVPVTYSGPCPSCGHEHALHATPWAVHAARRLMDALWRTGSMGTTPTGVPVSTQAMFSPGGGHMLGVLVGWGARGEPVEGRAFSGQVFGHWHLSGWVPPVVDPQRWEPWKTSTEAAIGALNRRIAAAQAQIASQEEQLSAQIEGLKRERDAALHALDAATATRKGKRKVRYRFNRSLQPLQAELHHLRAPIVQWRQERRQLSRRLMRALHATYELTNAHGQTVPLLELYEPYGTPPSGTADCCAPKLLHWAALRGIQPVGLAEFWWGFPSQRRHRAHAKLYSACEAKCKPLLGFLLCGAQHASDTRCTAE